MRKIIAFLPAVMLIASMAVTASACTPKLSIPKVPQISNIFLLFIFVLLALAEELLHACRITRKE